MTPESIKNLSDPRLAPYRELISVQPEQRDYLVAEGRWLVERLLQSRLEVQSVLVDENRTGLLPEIPPDTPIYTAPKAVIQELVGFTFHRGILAAARPPELPNFGVEQPDTAEGFLGVVCCEVCDPVNLGGILRNCAALGADLVVLGPGCADPFSRRVLRVSMGTALELPLVVSTNLKQDLRQAAEHQVWEFVGAIARTDATPLPVCSRAARTLLLIGNEGFGLPEALTEQCHRLVTIPISDRVDSLNAAASSAILLYHFQQVACRASES